VPLAAGGQLTSHAARASTLADVEVADLTVAETSLMDVYLVLAPLRLAGGPVTSRHTARHSAGPVLQGSGLGMQVWVLTMRSLRGAFGDPRLVFFGLLQPVVLLAAVQPGVPQPVSLPSVATTAATSTT